MTLLFPDVSQYNSVLPPGDVVIARASISNVKDSKYEQFKAAAAARHSAFTAYAFLNAPSLGVSVNAQADFAFSVIGSSIPMMIDLETNRGTCASLADGLNFANRYRSHGGICHLMYLPKWVWSGTMGSPSLVPLTAAGIGLVSSNYTTYSDTGPGWNSYGGVTPIQWQFTDNFQGTGADGNGFKGTLAQYLTIVVGSDTMAGSGITMSWGETLDAYFHRIESIWVPGANSAVATLATLNAYVAADAVRDQAVLTTIQALAAGGTSVDTSAVVAAIDLVHDDAKAQFAALHQENADLKAQVAAYQAKEAAAAQAEADALKS